MPSLQHRDLYLRVRPGQYTLPALVGPPGEARDAIAFVDIDAAVPIDPDAVVERLQSLPHLLTKVERLVFRLPWLGNDRWDEPTTWAEALADRRGAIVGGSIPVAVIEFGLGRNPQVTWSSTSRADVDDDRLLARCCVAETEALLCLGHAVWRPETYHYQLPSGVHDSVFVRLADAIREPRDADVLAHWILERVTEERVGVLLDSATMAPIALSLRTFAESAGLPLGPIVSTARYPSTRQDVERAARHAASHSGAALAMLSVSSSGRVRDLMVGALADSASTWSLDVLVDKSSDSLERLVEDEQVRAWVGVRDLGQPAGADECRLCRDRNRARLVFLNPETFGAMAVPEPDLLVPSPRSGQWNLRLWEHAAATGAIGLETVPADSSQPARPKGERLAVKVHFEQLFDNDDVHDILRRRFAELRGTEPREQFEVEILETLAEAERTDVLVVLKQDLELPGFERVLSTLQEQLGCTGADVVVVSGDDEHVDIQGREVLVVLAGTVTGAAARRLRLTVAGSSPPDTEVRAVVVHARPASLREWQTIVNQYNRKVVALWLTFLPWMSPLRDELQLLDEFAADRPALPGPVAGFLELRRTYCNPMGDDADWRHRLHAWNEDGALPDPHAVLWGLEASVGGRTQIRGRSLYGTGLDAVTAYAAMGAAVHHRRTTSHERSAPQWMMFEMAAVLGSYFDALIQGAFLRWVLPAEAWWGSRPVDAESAVIGALARSADDPADLKVLLPELLLAAALGKLSTPAARALQDQVPAYSSDLTEEERAPIELGTALLEWSR